MNSKLERIWKEEPLDQFEALSQHLLNRIEDTYEKFSQDGWCSGRDWSPLSETLTPELPCSMTSVRTENKLFFSIGES